MCIHNKKPRALSTSSVDMHRVAGQCSCQCVDLQQRLSGILANFSTHWGQVTFARLFAAISSCLFFVIFKNTIYLC